MRKMVVGLPRALMYYQYATLWEAFLTNLGTEVKVSGPTNKRILDTGAALVADEACLPVKVFFGHAAELSKSGVDCLFIPRMVSVEKKAYICPKLMGLPDMLEAAKLRLPPLVKPTMNLVASSRNLTEFIKDTGKFFTSSKGKVNKAWRIAAAAQKNFEQRLLQSFDSGSIQAKEGSLHILLLGHYYNIHDTFLNLNIKAKLAALGTQVVTPEDFPRQRQEEEAARLPKRLFWTYGKINYGTARCFVKFPGQKGVVLITSFGCGIDSFVDNMIIRYLQRAKVPFLHITLDEHTGEAGLNTRIEAFIDMIRWRWRRDNEDNLSFNGPYLGSCERIAGVSGP